MIEEDKCIFFLQLFCIFLQFMCIFFNLPPFFSNFSYPQLLELHTHVLRFGAKFGLYKLSSYQPARTIQYCKSGSMFSSSEPVAAHSDCRQLGNALCLCSPIQPAQAEQKGCPKSLAFDLPSKPSITFWNSLQRGCQMTGRGSNMDSNLNSDQQVVKVLKPPKSQHKLCGV